MAGVVKLKTITAPTEEPCTVAEVKAHLRVSGSDDDTYLGTLLTAARELAEAWTNRYIMLRTVEASWDDMPTEPAIELPRCATLSSLTWVKWYTDTGTATEITSNLHTDDYSEPVRLVLEEGQSWPSQGEVRMTNGLIVKYATGLDDAAVPEQVQLAVKEIVAAMYDRDTFDGMVPPLAKSLLAPYRLLRL